MTTIYVGKEYREVGEPAETDHSPQAYAIHEIEGRLAHVEADAEDTAENLRTFAQQSSQNKHEIGALSERLDALEQRLEDVAEIAEPRGYTVDANELIAALQKEISEANGGQDADEEFICAGIRLAIMITQRLAKGGRQ